MDFRVRTCRITQACCQAVPEFLNDGRRMIAYMCHPLLSFFFGGHETSALQMTLYGFLEDVEGLLISSEVIAMRQIWEGAARKGFTLGFETNESSYFAVGVPRPQSCRRILLRNRWNHLRRQHV